MSERVWTKEQQKAIDAQTGTLLVSAAAGSGKTSVLVERIIRKLTDPVAPCSPESLLVVTFTNAAASEMRAKILKRIGERAAADPERRRDYISIQARLDGMKVCTMDAYCMNFMRENFHACGIESDFRMLDGGELTVLKIRTAEEVIERLYGEDGEAFFALARLFEKGRNDDALGECIRKLSDFSMSEPYPEKWLKGIADNFCCDDPNRSIFGKLLTDEIADMLSYCIELIGNAVAELKCDSTLYAKTGPIFESDLDGLKSVYGKLYDINWDERMEALRWLFADLKSRSFSAPRTHTNDPVKLAAQEKRKCVNDLIGKYIEKNMITTAENAEDNAVLAPIAAELIKAVLLFNSTLLEHKREMNAFDFSDILHFTLSLLTDPGAPDGRTELAREIAADIDEIFIDEYQDTNRAQETLFESISKDGKNMFMVGDVKQSIYKFRLASPELFTEKCEAYPYYDGKAEKSKIILGNNFRSRRGVTDAVNFIFSTVMSKQCGGIDYNDDERLNFSAGYPDSTEPSLEVDILKDPLYTKCEAEAVYIASLIKHEIENGLQVWENNKARPAVYGDFCILLRSAKGLAEVYEKALADVGIRASTGASGNFFDCTEIRILMSFLRVINDPSRDVELLALMMSPLFGFSVDDAARVRIKGKEYFGGNKDISLWAAVRISADAGDRKCIELGESVRYYKKLAATLNVGELLRTVLNDTAFLSVCGSMKDGEQRKGNVRRLLEYAESGPENMRTLSGFIRFADAMRDNGAKTEGVSKPSDPSCVSIMTIHRSKGLEFPFVIIAGTVKKINDADLKDAIFISHEYGIGLKRRDMDGMNVYDTLSSAAIKNELKRSAMSEELRIFYVALTRAKEKLYIVAAPEKAQETVNKLNMLLSGCDTVPPYFVRNVAKTFDWLLAGLLRHPCAGAIGGCATGKADERAIIRFIDSLPVAAIEDICDDVSALPDEDTVRRLSERVSFNYKYAPVSSTLSKHAASTVNDEKFSPEYFAKAVPAFMSSSSLTSADRGTATHKFLQYCDFSVCKTSPESERERLVEQFRLTRAEADCVDMESVKSFVLSDIMRRCEKAEQVFREKEFTLSKSVCDMDPSVPEEFRDEKTVVIGKIDMVFVEDGQAVIVDYKTDNIKDINILRERYGDQLKLYSEAVERIMGIKVKQCILYSLKLRESIDIIGIV